MTTHIFRKDSEGNPIALRLEVPCTAGRDPDFVALVARVLLSPRSSEFHVRRFEVERTFVALVVHVPDERAMGAEQNVDLDRWAHEARERLSRAVLLLERQAKQDRMAEAFSADDVIAYVDEAKYEAGKRGRITGEPLAQWIRRCVPIAEVACAHDGELGVCSVYGCDEPAVIRIKTAESWIKLCAKDTPA